MCGGMVGTPHQLTTSLVCFSINFTMDWGHALPLLPSVSFPTALEEEKNNPDLPKLQSTFISVYLRIASVDIYSLHSKTNAQSLVFLYCKLDVQFLPPLPLPTSLPFRPFSVSFKSLMMFKPTLWTASMGTSNLPWACTVTTPTISNWAWLIWHIICSTHPGEQKLSPRSIRSLWSNVEISR